MKSTRILMACVIVAGVLTQGSYGESRDSQPELAIRMGAVVPSRDEDWSSAGTAEFQLRFWHDESVGVALAIGAQTWSAQDEYIEDWDGHSLLATSVGGEADLLPVGASILFRGPGSGPLRWTLETGLRYAFVDSAIVASTEYSDVSGGYSYEENTIESEDVILGVVALSLEVRIAEPLHLIGGLGYQFGLNDPHETFQGEDLGETNFDGTTVTFGIAWQF